MASANLPYPAPLPIGDHPDMAEIIDLAPGWPGVALVENTDAGLYTDDNAQAATARRFVPA